jgi:uncharacterized membrane protein
MLEAVIYFFLLTVFSFIDIGKMTKANLKKESLPYILLAALAGVIGLLFFRNPYGDSLASRLLNLFHME